MSHSGWFYWLGIAILAPVACYGQAPAIKSGGVVSASAFGQFTSIAPGSWIEIYGSNLATNTRGWAGADFQGANAPTSLDGTSVTIGGQMAFIDYISPGQVNAQVPSGIGAGSQPVVVTVGTSSSAPYTVSVRAVQPGLLAPLSFNIGGKQYAAALFPDGVTYVLPPGSIAGVNSRRAQPGDTITFYGIGFGPVTPNIPAGQVVQQSNTLTALQVQIGGNLAMVNYSGLAPGAVGLYQFNVVVPSVPTNDAAPLTFTLGGVAGTQTLYVPVGTPPAQIQSVTLSQPSVVGGGTATGTVVGAVTLSATAPPGGAVVALSSNSSAASVPPTVTVPAGALSATFTVATTPVTTNQTAAITASYGGGSAQVSLTVIPATTGAFRLIEISPANFVSPIPSGGGAIAISFISGQLGTLMASFIPQSAAQAATTPSLVQANFNNVSVTGQTYTLSGVQETSFMHVLPGQSYPITAGSVTVTLSPSGNFLGQVTGTVTGTYTLTSSLTTLSGTISGAFQALP